MVKRLVITKDKLSTVLKMCHIYFSNIWNLTTLPANQSNIAENI
jgi:hypothetical protein